MAAELRPLFKKILIANRGEIAVRIIRTCRDMGIISVAVYSEADRESLHRLIADESVCIGPARAADSYLNIDAVITAALITGADAIHPGYGFLSERADFAQRCEENGIAFIGPSYESLVLMGDKITAKETAKRAGAPVIPGSEGLVSDLSSAMTLCREIGYPVMVKASCGGGGKGIRMVGSEEELARSIDNARAEAKANFGEDGVYIEKCVVNPRHIEVQIIADKQGNTCHLFERDCSMQRRHQKIIEEAPSPYLTPELRDAMGKCAVNIAREARYYNAGTVEFLVSRDENSGEKRFYFMEMNTRIQVEHPVTETVTGIDIIRSQIEIAAGMTLPFAQGDIRLGCHAIECRINAEDPMNNFAACPGTIDELNMPGGIGVRIDSAAYQGYRVPPYYDSMLAKLIVSGRTRNETIIRMRRALAELIFSGIVTNADFQSQLLSGDTFASGEYSSDYLDKLDIKKLMEES